MKLSDLLGKKYEEWKKRTSFTSRKRAVWAVSRRGEVSVYEIPEKQDVAIGYVINDEDIVFAVGRSNEVEYTAKTIKEYALEQDKILQRLTLRNDFDDNFYMEIKGGLSGLIAEIFRKREPRDIGEIGIGFTVMDGKGEFISAAIYDTFEVAGLSKEKLTEILIDTDDSVILFGIPYTREYEGREYRNIKVYGMYFISR